MRQRFGSLVLFTGNFGGCDQLSEENVSAKCKRWRMCGVIFAVVLLQLSCSLAPSNVDPAPIFELNGTIDVDRSEIDSDDTPILLALSWYVFTTNSLDPAAFSLATQTITSTADDYEFALALNTVPPPSAFVLTGAGRFLELPADGNLAIGFITARPWNEAASGTFAWTTPDMVYQTCPFESQLVVWWDGPELDHEQIGFESGTLRKGLNLLDVSEGGNGPEGYRLFPADAPIEISICDDGYRPPLRSCGLPQERSIETIYVSASENLESNPEPPAGSFQCDQCGATYRAPDVCIRRLDILCRDCRSLVVETDPTNPPPDWICESPPDYCEGNEDEVEEPLCLLGRRFRCVDNAWQFFETCSDPCCEGECSAE